MLYIIYLVIYSVHFIKIEILTCQNVWGTSMDINDKVTVEESVPLSQRAAASCRVGMALMKEKDKNRLLHTVVRAAFDTTQADFAACFLRSLDDEGHIQIVDGAPPFHLVSALGEISVLETFMRHMPLATADFLQPIVHLGLPLRVADIQAASSGSYSSCISSFDNVGVSLDSQVRQHLFDEPSPVAGLSAEPLKVRSFLGIPLLNRDDDVIGCFLLGHSQLGHFTADDEVLLVGMASVATVAMENVRLHHVNHLREVERQTQQQTMAQNMALQMILNEMPGSVYLARGHDARLFMINRAGDELLKRSWRVGQPLQEFLAEIGVQVEDERGCLIEHDQFATVRALRYGKAVKQYQEVLRFPDGSRLPVMVSATPLDPAQWLTRSMSKMLSLDFQEPLAIVIHQDVTIFKEAEHLKDDFIGIAAHELRNPLATLCGFAQTLLSQTERGHGPPLADWQFEAINGINQAANRMSTLANDLLDVTRLHADRLHLQMEPCDLVALTKRVCTRAQITTDRHQLNLHSSLEYLVVLADAHRMEQVISNLISNAIKYSLNGGAIELNIEEVQSLNHIAVAQFSIQDHGIGIPKDQQSIIFGRFNRAENAQSIGGTGLGLYLSQALVDQQGGHIWFESVEGQGTTFFISLPLYRE